MHVRRGDFAKMCKDVPVDDCMPSLSAYARKVQEIKDQLLVLKALQVHRVIVTSDESDPAWWQEVQSYGWAFFDHEKEATVAKYGKW